MGSIIPFFILHDSPLLKKKNSSTFWGSLVTSGLNSVTGIVPFPALSNVFRRAWMHRVFCFHDLWKGWCFTSKSRFVGKSALVPSSMKCWLVWFGILVMGYEIIPKKNGVAVHPIYIYILLSITRVPLFLSWNQGVHPHGRVCKESESSIV